MQRVRILKDSLHPNKKDRFTTFLISFPKCLLAQLNTHRQLVRNCGSSRAIPIAKLIKQVEEDPFVPIFSRNQKGMVGLDNLTPVEEAHAAALWEGAMEASLDYADGLNAIGIHKEAVNRLLEPFMYVDVVLSGTEFEPFFKMRCPGDVQKSFTYIANEAKCLYDSNEPTQLNYGDWHIPFDDYFPEDSVLLEKLKIAIARIARVSYQSHAGDFLPTADMQLYERLLKDMHMSPFEHVAKVVDNKPTLLKKLLPPVLGKYLFALDWFEESVDNPRRIGWSRQYAGFYTYRSHLEDGVDIV